MVNENKLTKRVLSLVTVAGALVTTSVGSAQVDSKIFPGSMCKPGSSAISYNVVHSPDSAYWQNYNARVQVVCPVVRDRVLSTTAAAAYLSVYDAVSNGFVWCALYSANSVGGTISYGYDSTSDPFVGNTTLIMSTGVGSGWYDAITVVCNLDYNDRIYSYNIDEALQQD
jgi:hypothetical protein